MSARALRLFLTTRRTRSTLIATVLLGALTATLGGYQTPVPTAVEQGQAVIPLWRMLTLGVAVLPVLSLHSPLADLELVATRRLRRYQRSYLAATGLGCALIHLGISAIAAHPPVLLTMARSWLAWYGLALIAGAALGWRLAWTLPTLVAVVCWYWGYQGGERYQWWDFTARTPDDLPSLLLSLGLLAAGVLAYASTPWRRRRYLHRRRPNRRARPTAPGSVQPTEPRPDLVRVPDDAR